MTNLTIERTLAATPERVWLALTDAGELASWLWPASWSATATSDVRVGGRYRVASDSTGMAISGEYVELEQGRRVVQTWQWDGEDDVTVVTMTLAPDGDGTLLRVVHERFADTASRDQHVTGWTDGLDRLPLHLATL